MEIIPPTAPSTAAVARPISRLAIAPTATPPASVAFCTCDGAKRPPIRPEREKEAMHDAESATTVLAMHTLPYLGSLRYHGGGVGWSAGAGGLYYLVWGVWKRGCCRGGAGGWLCGGWAWAGGWGG